MRLCRCARHESTRQRNRPPCAAVTTDGPLEEAIMKDSVQQAVAHLVLLTTQLISSGYSVLAKNAVATFDSVIFAFFRLTGGMLILMSISFLLNKKKGTQWLPRKGDWSHIWLYAFTAGFFNQLSYVLALRFLPASVVSMFGPLNPVCAMCFALVLKQEAFSYLRLGAVVLALVGAGIMLSIDQVVLGLLDPAAVSEPMTWSTALGYACALANTLNSGLLRSSQKKTMERLPLTMANAWMNLLGGGMLLLVTPFFWGNFTPLTITPMAWVALAYAIVFAAVINYMLGSYSSRHVSPTAFSLWGALAPFLTCTLAVIFLGESLTVRHWIGGFIVVLSLLLVIYARHVEIKGRPGVAGHAAPTPAPQSPATVHAGTELTDLATPTATSGGAHVSPPVLPSVTLPEPPRARLTAPGAEETVVVSMVPHHGGGYQQTAAMPAAVAPFEQTPIVMVANPSVVRIRIPLPWGTQPLAVMLSPVPELAGLYPDREEQIKSVYPLFAQAQLGPSFTAFVHGPASTGKSTILREFSSRMAPTVSSVMISCEAMFQIPDYFNEIINAILSEILKSFQTFWEVAYRQWFQYPIPLLLNRLSVILSTRLLPFCFGPVRALGTVVYFDAYTDEQAKRILLAKHKATLRAHQPPYPEAERVDREQVGEWILTHTIQYARPIDRDIRKVMRAFEQRVDLIVGELERTRLPGKSLGATLNGQLATARQAFVDSVRPLTFAADHQLREAPSPLAALPRGARLLFLAGFVASHALPRSDVETFTGVKSRRRARRGADEHKVRIAIPRSPPRQPVLASAIPTSTVAASHSSIVSVPSFTTQTRQTDLVNGPPRPFPLGRLLAIFQALCQAYLDPEADEQQQRASSAPQHGNPLHIPGPACLSVLERPPAIPAGRLVLLDAAYAKGAREEAAEGQEERQRQKRSRAEESEDKEKGGEKDREKDGPGADNAGGGTAGVGIVATAGGQPPYPDGGRDPVAPGMPQWDFPAEYIALIHSYPAYFQPRGGHSQQYIFLGNAFEMLPLAQAFDVDLGQLCR
ncbi:hypothetical protein PAPYR_2881 [Paratrimastix pyriformis]|uniref:EamA domain-containing protein n=1 Tax=Paratrimastix pyriformis TaxID=342808 RepID=A0ABQ8UNA5_9EUKA|nr:hypothetical protein PAPYR_2881 [Paratrimastix pyriformis]